MKRNCTESRILHFIRFNYSPSYKNKDKLK